MYQQWPFDKIRNWPPLLCKIALCTITYSALKKNIYTAGINVRSSESARRKIKSKSRLTLREDQRRRRPRESSTCERRWHRVHAQDPEESLHPVATQPTNAHRWGSPQRTKQHSQFQNLHRQGEGNQWAVWRCKWDGKAMVLHAVEFHCFNTDLVKTRPLDFWTRFSSWSSSRRHAAFEFLGKLWRKRANTENRCYHSTLASAHSETLMEMSIAPNVTQPGRRPKMLSSTQGRQRANGGNHCL